MTIISAEAILAQNPDATVLDAICLRAGTDDLSVALHAYEAAQRRADQTGRAAWRCRHEYWHGDQDELDAAAHAAQTALTVAWRVYHDALHASDRQRKRSRRSMA